MTKQSPGGGETLRLPRPDKSGLAMTIGHAFLIIRLSRMMTLDLYPLGVSLFPFTSPPDPLSSRRGGNKYSWGTPPDPRQREIPLDSL